MRHNGTFIDAGRCNDVDECLCTYEVAVRYDRKEGLQERIRETQKREGWGDERETSENSLVDARRRSGGCVVGVIATGGGCLLLVLGK